MQEVRAAYRSIDTLIVDDIQCFARKSATQEEFFHTFNTLHTLDKQIILSANELPSHLQDIEPRLISRFEWGVSFSLHPPSPQDLGKILQQKAKLLELPLTTELLHFLIKNFSSNPKAPIEALHALALRSSGPTSLTEVKRLLSDLLLREQASLLSAEQIIKQTAAYFGIKLEDLTGPSQMRTFAQPRQIAMYLCRTLLNLPFQGIGRIFDRDHSTVMTSVRAVKNARETKAEPFTESAEYLTKLLMKRGSYKT
jgi:chromosomal replication initiator protein